jgi:hypothetical protein
MSRSRALFGGLILLYMVTPLGVLFRLTSNTVFYYSIE